MYDVYSFLKDTKKNEKKGARNLNKNRQFCELYRKYLNL